METLTGTLHRSRTRRASRDWVKDFGRRLAEEAGVVEPRYYREQVFVSGDTLNTTGRQTNVWSLTSAKAFEGLPDGARVQFRAVVKRWDNGNGHSLGGTCSRVRDVEVLPPSVRAGDIIEDAIVQHAAPLDQPTTSVVGKGD